jgi:D-alanyl-D-alanine carboxypeptidase/D-alanyl-D-alanine-endopeptidase (penicillin-binding protein 4)
VVLGLAGAGAGGALALSGGGVAHGASGGRPADRRSVPAPSVASAEHPPVGPIPSTTTTTTPAQVVAGALTASLAGTTGCAISRTGTGPLAAAGSAVPVASASTQKLVTAAAALSVLGPGYRFVTRVVAAGPPQAGVEPRLWLVGAADPMLSTGGYRALVARTDHLAEAPPFTPLEWLATSLRQAGVSSVPGGISGDESLLSGPRYLPTWKPVYLSEDDVGPLSALSLNEGWQQWQGQTLPATDPPTYAADTLAGLLRQDGAAVGPAGPDSAAPPGAVTLATVDSVPLAQIVAYMLATSDNHIAELLVRLVGRARSASGTTPAGTQAVLGEVARLGVPTRGVVMVDGSGLSPQNRSTCPELLAAYQLGSRPGFAALWSGLPVAGRSGTLYRQWAGTPLAGRVVAKTGWIDGVAAIVGTVEGARPADFAWVANGNFNYAEALARQTVALQALANYADG